MVQKYFTLKSRNCFHEAKKPRFCFIVAKNGSKQNRADVVGDLAGDVGAFFVLLKHRSNFFQRSDFAGDLAGDVGANFLY
jgi:hypothetical protein